MTGLCALFFSRTRMVSLLKRCLLGSLCCVSACLVQIKCKKSLHIYVNRLVFHLKWCVFWYIEVTKKYNFKYDAC